MGNVLTDGEFEDILRKVKEALDQNGANVRADVQQHSPQPGVFRAAAPVKDILPLHQKALGAIKSATDEVQDVLTKLALAIGVMWVAIAAAFTAIEAIVVSTLVPAFTDLQQHIAQNDGFPHGHWPTLTKDISNSSMSGTDNDPSTDDIPWVMSKA